MTVSYLQKYFSIVTAKEVNHFSLSHSSTSLTWPIEVIALVSLSPDHLTLSGSVLDALAALPALAADSFTPPPAASFSPPFEGTCDNPRLIRDVFKLMNKRYSGDYLANGGALLGEALERDVEVQRKLADALAIFGEKERETRALVKAFVAGI
jgi:transaldolase